jgi:hypothetical protein
MNCAWPEGDPRDASFSFCGEPVARSGLPYCAEHMRAAYLRDPTRRPVLRKSPRPKPSASVNGTAECAVNAAAVALHSQRSAGGAQPVPRTGADPALPQMRDPASVQCLRARGGPLG